MPDVSAIFLPIVVFTPAVLSVLTLFKPARRPVALGVTLFTMYIAIRLFLSCRAAPISFELMRIGDLSFSFYADNLSGFIVMGCSFFALLLTIYSPAALEGLPGSRMYQFYILLTIAAANGAALAHNLLMIVLFWGFLAGILYAIMMIPRKDPAAAAQKALLIIGISDVMMLFGFVLLFSRGIFTVTLNQPLICSQPFYVAVFILILVGALAKAGAMPLHSWIPEAASTAPASTMAFIPASLDKLLGIYLLVRVSYFIFNIQTSVGLRLLLLIIGAITIVAAVMMALVQKEAIKLLSFHAVSQVGYMVMGIGTGIPVAIAGGLFHMINHAVYKACLFLSAGAVEYRAKTSELEHLGGLGVKMPITCISFLIAAMAISGVPPLNGFYSKWMIYQGVVELSRETNFWTVFLIAAMFGSVLTLASFLKMVHSLFLGDRPRALEKVREAGFDMTLPQIVLAFICLVFGVFAIQLPLKYLILPSLPMTVTGTGFWSPTIAAALIIVALVLGAILFLLGTGLRPRKSPLFIGGEILAEEEARVPGTAFYSPVKSFAFLAALYEKGGAGVFDLYYIALRFFNGIATFVLNYVDRLTDRIIQVFVELAHFFSQTIRSVLVWFIVLLLLPFLSYIASGSFFSLQALAAMLLVGGPLFALTSVNLNRFLQAIAVGQLGAFLLSLSSGNGWPSGIALYQLLCSFIALDIVYIGIRTAINISGRTNIDEIQGLAGSAGVVTVGFIVGGLMLSALPPSMNFIGKFLTTSKFEGNIIIIVLVSTAAFFNLAAFLRIIRKVFLGPPVLQAKKKFGSEELITIILIIISIVFTFQSNYFVKFLEAGVLK